MTFRQELTSWLSPARPSIPTAPSTPAVGSRAPATPALPLATPPRKTLLVFLRHCGCPFAEKAWRDLRALAAAHPDVDCVAVSHSDRAASARWLRDVLGSRDDFAPARDLSRHVPEENLRVWVDEGLEAYATWGLGTTGWLHTLSPSALWNVYALGKGEGIWNRPTESGSRWQQGGAFAVDEKGIVVWGKGDDRADDTLGKGLEEGVSILEKGEK